MKTQPFFKSLIQLAAIWKRRYKALFRLYVSKTGRRHSADSRRSLRRAAFPGENRDQKFLCSSSMVNSAKPKCGIYAAFWGFIPQHSVVVFAIALVTMTGVMGHKLYNQPQLQEEAIARETIVAPYTATIENIQETELLREAARGNSRQWLMVDKRINQTVEQNLQRLLQQANQVRTTAGSFPFFDREVLHPLTQIFLRSASDEEWKQLLISLENGNQDIARDEKPQGVAVANSTDAILTQIPTIDTTTTNPHFKQALSQLQLYGAKTSPQNLRSLIGIIEKKRTMYVQAKAKLAVIRQSKPGEILYNDTSVLDFSDDEWSEIQVAILQTAQLILAQGIHSGLPQENLEYVINLHLQKSLIPPDAKFWTNKLLVSVLQPNLKQDEQKTQLQAEKAAGKIQPVMVTVQKGELIVRKGEIITAWNLAVLENYNLIRREINWLELTYLASAIAAAISVYALVEKRIKIRLRQSDRLLVLLLALSCPSLLIFGTPFSTWSALGLLLGSFYGRKLGLTVIGLLLILLLPMSLEVGNTAIIAGAAGGILGTSMAQHLRSREELAVLGFGISLTEGGVYLLLKILLGTAFTPTSYLVFQEAGLLALSGLGWSIVALGLSPYLEKLFDLVTPIRLAELASPNRPLLKRLAKEAPGTFQHTLFVATLAEAAAKELGCNVDLIRAGTLYHDIGKMHDPMGFIENQMGGPNKHETEINDPWLSADIIKKHVSEGLIMARKHSLPTAIQAFIPEHQGTMQIAYFYHQAQELAKDNPTLQVKEEDFRYEGPIPQSRESGILMLADSCEAALRSLRDATPEKALNMVNNILRARWKDNQLSDSGLTRQEMTKIAEIFVKVWQQFHHKRIAYPKLKANN
ncbi:HDIG domain-containing protein [Plectonema cf. radiosum LEGE 06105]|uniref:HDIG domain-containing protein n=1 Tax=Plectonema cf. radiosum LEGE 06105 TaxID=945769 RepID=A0A8J7FBM3_9CYAN|nr:HDIG domain-containing metalloprotein [Plectonema radiosum]MBE9211271.1 HDIG domain-containing protein [Plectonema cf. radiosum LEGE 06105]